MGQTRNGQRVELVGLSAANMNGLTGQCGALDTARIRYEVTLDGPEKKVHRRYRHPPPSPPTTPPPYRHHPENSHI